MVLHHTDYKKNVTEPLTKGQHFFLHVKKCKGCGDRVINPLIAKLKGAGPAPGEKYKFYQHAGWIAICDSCFLEALKVPGLIITELYKATWPHARPVYGSEEDGKRFVGEYIRRYPMKHKQIKPLMVGG